MSDIAAPADHLLASLRAHFGHQEFRPGQEPVVAGILSGRDVLAVMPTGSGKSIGYQLPAVNLPGTTLVVSPLISLMKDQVDELTRRGIRSAALHSMLSARERREVLAAARAAHLRLLYVAPERFASREFLELLGQLSIARFIVDEAHCVSEWGHDFRPDYRRLKEAAASCRATNGVHARPPIAAFTATATPEVRQDIVALLGLEAPLVRVAGFDRPNIFLRIERVGSESEKHDLLPSLVKERRALVYAATRKTSEAAADRLQAVGIACAAYHAGLKDDERVRVQDAFASGALRVVCATNAFGMGIDRPDVEAVVHFAIPGSVEAYYQEIGRAGRDGRDAIATLLWDPADVSLRQFLIDSPRRDQPGRRRFEVDPEDVARRKVIEHRRLDRMVGYAETGRCLRATILRYFGDPAAREPCGACGNCHPYIVDPGDLEVVRVILRAVQSTGERYGRRRMASFLLGRGEDWPPALQRLRAFGALKDLEIDALEGWISAAIGGGLLQRSNDDYRVLSLSPAGRDFLEGRLSDVRVTRPARRPALHDWPQTRDLYVLGRRRRGERHDW